jgi:hypothetical protein
LQCGHAIWALSNVAFPPRDRGMAWSTCVAVPSRRQNTQVAVGFSAFAAFLTLSENTEELLKRVAHLQRVQAPDGTAEINTYRQDKRQLSSAEVSSKSIIRCEDLRERLGLGCSIQSNHRPEGVRPERRNACIHLLPVEDGTPTSTHDQASAGSLASHSVDTPEHRWRLPVSHLAGLPLSRRSARTGC